MFGMGWQEILLILVIAVLVIGPDQMPQVARTIGRLIAQFRRLTNDLRDSVNREFQENEGFKDFKDFQNSVDSEVRGITHTVNDYVEREVAKGEAELKKIEDDNRSALEVGDGETNDTSVANADDADAHTGDPGPLSDPPEPKAWSNSIGDFPDEADFAPAKPADDTARTAETDAGGNGSDDTTRKDQDPATGPRRETA